jgi:flagellar hook-associated protein 2
LDATLLAASTETVTISVAQTSDAVAAALQLFVDQYNKLRDKLDTYTALNPDAGTKGTLFGTSEALRLDSELAGLITGRHNNGSGIQSLAELGVSIDEQGHLSLDKTKLQERFDADPDAVSGFFADEDLGFAAKVDSVLEKLVGRDRSLLITRTEVLQRKIDDFGERIDVWDERLTRSRERLLLQFFNLEQVVSRLQNNLTALGQLQIIKPISNSE